MMALSPQFLEAVNGTLLVVFLGILFFFGRYIGQAIYAHGWCIGRSKRKAAIGVFVLISGDTIIRACIWLARHHQNTGHDIATYTTAVTAVTTAGVAICLFGGICVLRHFAPKQWGQWPWIITSAAALAFGIGMAL